LTFSLGHVGIFQGHVAIAISGSFFIQQYFSTTDLNKQ